VSSNGLRSFTILTTYYTENKKAVLSQGTIARCRALVQKAWPNPQSTQTHWIETTLKLSTNMGSWQERLYKCFFACTEQYFGDLKTISVDFCIRYAESPPYFYFRSTWPTDLESVSYILPLTMKIFTKFEADMTFRCRDSILGVDTFRDLVTLNFDYWPWSVVILGGSHDQPLHCVW